MAAPMTSVGPDVPAPDVDPDGAPRSSERKFRMPALPSGVPALTDARPALRPLNAVTYRYLTHAGSGRVRERYEQLELPFEW